jgi:hypothetical protein
VYDYVSITSFLFDFVTLTSFYTLLVFFHLKTIPAQDCYDNCMIAAETCCGATDDKPSGKCIEGETLNDKCKKEYYDCNDKCDATTDDSSDTPPADDSSDTPPADDEDTTTKFTTDFDVDIEGAVVVGDSQVM